MYALPKIQHGLLHCMLGTLFQVKLKQQQQTEITKKMSNNFKVAEI